MKSTVLIALIGFLNSQEILVSDSDSSLDNQILGNEKISILKDDIDYKCYHKKLAYFTCDKDPDCTWCQYLGTYKDQRSYCSKKLTAIHTLDTADWHCPAVNMTNEYRHCLDHYDDRDGCKNDPICDGCISKEYGPADFVCLSKYSVSHLDEGSDL